MFHIPLRPGALPLLAAGLTTLLWAQQATIQEEKQVMKTYPYSGADPAPIMTRSSMWGKGPRLYPYYFFDKLSVEGKDQTWNIVRMENPYIRAFIMPPIGGRLWGALEKSTNKEFIYHNKVAKFRHIALRGPWTSGGIELNFGIVGHTPSTAAPVDYILRKNPDGSVSCIVGNLDLPSRTNWRVEFILPPDKAYIESRAFWYNPQPLHQSYYVWMTAANKLTDDLEFIFPGNAYIGHDYSVPEEPWPVSKEGRNLALFKGHLDSDSDSFFIHGVLDEFAGNYWHNSAFGFGHWALPEDMPGRKFFRWGLSRAGAIWEDLLTDTDGQYFEPQMGRLLDQNDHEFFPPYSADRWREVWFPYKEIGPMVKATPHGALNARSTGQAVEIAFCPLQKIDEELVVRAGDKEILRERLALGPMEVYRKTLPVAVKQGQLRVDVGDKLSYSDDVGARTLKRPLNFRDYEENTLEGLYQAAEREEKGRNFDLALEKYLACLKKEPLHMRALVRVAELYCRRAEYATALDYARKALDYAMYDPDANYIYGVIARKMGNLVDARDTLGWAARSMKYRSAAFCQLGEIHLMERQWEHAGDFLKRSLDYDAYNVKTYQVSSTLHRLRGRSAQAREAIGKLLEIDPLNHLARFERYLLELEPNQANRDEFQSLIRNELPHETYLEIAMHYVNLKLDGDALKALELAPRQATVRYWMAYLTREKDPGRSRQLLEDAASLSPRLVFPYREEEIPVFDWAARTLPQDWKARYYLGLIHWGLHRRQEALAAMDELGARPDFGAFYLSRANLRGDSDPKRTQADLERAHAVDPAEWRNWFHLGNFYTARGMNAQALKIAEGAAKRFPDEDLVKILLAKTYLNNRRYSDCYSMLEKATILPFEGQRNVHETYVQCQLSLALADMKQSRYREAVGWLDRSREFPERLGTGKPSHPDYRVQDYLELLAYGKLGDSAQAAKARERIRAYTGGRRGGAPEEVTSKVEQWYAALGDQSEAEALRKLAEMVRGGSRRRH